MGQANRQMPEQSLEVDRPTRRPARDGAQQTGQSKKNRREPLGSRRLSAGETVELSKSGRTRRSRSSHGPSTSVFAYRDSRKFSSTRPTATSTRRNSKKQRRRLTCRCIAGSPPRRRHNARRSRQHSRLAATRTPWAKARSGTKARSPLRRRRTCQQIDKRGNNALSSPGCVGGCSRTTATSLGATVPSRTPNDPWLAWLACRPHFTVTSFERTSF